MRLVGFISTIHGLTDRRTIKYWVRIRIIGIIHLIANAPQENRRVISVATHHIHHVLFHPFLEEIERTIITWFTSVPSFYPFAFRKFPFIESLVFYQQSHLITKVIECGSLWIMTHSNGVYANLLEVFQSSFPYIARNYGSQSTSIMMQTYSFHFHPLTIQGKSLIGVELQGSQSCSHLTTINLRSVMDKFCQDGI